MADSNTFIVRSALKFGGKIRREGEELQLTSEQAAAIPAHCIEPRAPEPKPEPKQEQKPKGGAKK